MTEEIKKALSHLRVPPSGTEQELHEVLRRQRAEKDIEAESRVIKWSHYTANFHSKGALCMN